MDFTREQEAALEAVQHWLDGSDAQVFRMFGYAGTGKTTLARHLGASHYAAFTGKAAYVMRQKGCQGASTIHSLIYVPREKSRARLKALQEQLLGAPEEKARELEQQIAEERANLARPSWSLRMDSVLRRARLLVIDECSMVDERMGLDLLSFGCKVLVLGDPFQLPPVAGGGYFTESKPDVLLTEVHRQARGNPVLDLATRVREEKRLPEEHECLFQGKLDPDMVTGVDQFIVGRNRTRRNANRRFREVMGFDDPLPMRGDKVVCTRNNHDLGLLNGGLHEVTDTSPEEHWIELDGGLTVDYHPELFLGQEVKHWAWDEAESFEYGYALTCHKAQGSQWDHVGVVDESRTFGPHAARWLYTAVTRAAKSIWVAVSA